jgi:hypothetical protein
VSGVEVVEADDELADAVTYSVAPVATAVRRGKRHQRAVSVVPERSPLRELFELSA